MILLYSIFDKQKLIQFFLSVIVLCLLIQVWLDSAKEIQKQIRSM